MASYCVSQDALSSCTTDCDNSGDVLSTRELTGDTAPRVLTGAGIRLPQPVSQYALEESMVSTVGRNSQAQEPLSLENDSSS